MIVYGYIPKSKAKKKPKAVREQYEQWLKTINNTTTKFAISGSKIKSKPSTGFPNLAPPPGRESVRINSLNPTNMAPCTKKGNIPYTGDKMIGIGTMHKSNMIPIFTEEQAVDVATMRRG
jgi:hypothetical protein